MRWYIIKALLIKEWQRHLANRGGITLALLMVVGAVLLSVFAPKESASAAGTDLVGGVRHCFVYYDRETDLVAHLKANTGGFGPQLKFLQLDPSLIGGVLNAPTSSGSLHLRQTDAPGKPSLLAVYVWHPKNDPTGLRGYETWLWKELRRFYAAEARRRGLAIPPDPEFDPENQWVLMDSHQRFRDQVAGAAGTSGAPFAVPELEVTRKGLGGDKLDQRSAIATGLVVFALYFTCVYLLPTLNCEERERGVLLAQALSPASPTEIVAAKLLFYPTAGIVLAATIAAIYKTTILSDPFFWLSLLAVGGGFLGIGMTIATLARTQKAAFLGGMCYLMAVSMLLFICSMNGIPFLPYLAVEYHGPRILHAALSENVKYYHWYSLLGEGALAVVWLTVAAWLFRRRGWQ